MCAVSASDVAFLAPSVVTQRSRQAGLLLSDNCTLLAARRIPLYLRKHRHLFQPVLATSSAQSPDADNDPSANERASLSASEGPPSGLSGPAEDMPEDEFEEKLSNVLDNMGPRPRVNLVEDDQFTEFERRDVKALARAKAAARAVDRVDAHRYLMLPDECLRMFEVAARRHGADLDKADVPFRRRFVVAKGIADPTFGRNRGMTPYPARYCCFESFTSLAESSQGVSATTAWLDGVDRVLAGNPLSPFKNHVSEWARLAEEAAENFGADHPAMRDIASCIVATEVVNSQYNGAAMDNTKSLLTAHGAESVLSGDVLIFEVLQSVKSPTCFKTFELYESVEHLRRHMSKRDDAFAASVMPWRAAVNRVRQINTPLVIALNES